MRIVGWFLGLVGCLAMMSGSAAAQRVTFSGSGSVASTGGRLVPTGIAPVGSPLRFSFSFDPAAAALFESDDGYALYELAVSDFGATLGAFTFPLSNDPSLVPLVELYRGFTFFGSGNGTEPSIGFTFYLLGEPTTAASVSPFAGAVGRNQQLALSGVVRDDLGTSPLTIAGLLGRGDVFYQDFQYGTRDAAAGRSGVLNGRYVGSFAAAVPEPATWAMMIFGFGSVGLALRRRRPAVAGHGLR